MFVNALMAIKVIMMYRNSLNELSVIMNTEKKLLSKEINK